MSRRVPLAAGTMLGRYQILGLAGEGGMGDIYRAMDGSLERVVALKRVRAGAADDAVRERFRREALALAQLNHPGICQVFELAETIHGLFIAMEWVGGETLLDRLQRGPLPWREAAEILAQTAEALAAAHAKGIVHRDLKPSNLMITPEGRVKVLDFGLVRFIDSEAESAPQTLGPEQLDPGEAATQAGFLSGSGSGRALTRVGSFMGTLGYTSPEQSLARPVGPPSDVFNLGLLAQEMVTGRRAFLGEGRDALDAIVDNQREPFPRGLAPKAFRALVDRMLAAKPKERPAAPEAAEELRRLLAPHGALWWSGLSAALVFGFGALGLWLYGRGAIAGLVKGRPARLVVMGFKNGTGVPMLDAQTELGLADLVASRLRAEPKLQLIGPDALAQAAHALKLVPAEASPEDQLRLAKALGADLVLSGDVDRAGGQDHLRYALRDAKGRLRAQGDADAKPFSETMLDAIPLAQSASRALQKAVDPFGKDARSEPYTITPEAFAAYAQGVEAYRHGHYKDAEPLLKQAAYAVPEWTEAVTAYAAAASALSVPNADDGLRWALVAARKEARSYDEANILLFLGRLSNYRRDFAAAKSYYGQSLDSARRQGDESSMAFALNGLGVAAEGEGHPDIADERYAEALEAASRSGDLLMRGDIITNLGNRALGKGDLTLAAQRYQEVVDTARASGDEMHEALGLNNLGITLLSEFKTAEAKAALTRALAIRDRNGDSLGVVSALRNLGINDLVEGRLMEAQAWFQRSLEKANAISLPYGQGQALFYLAECDRRKGDLGAAMKRYETAIPYSEAIHDLDKLGPELAGEAECLIKLHRASEADPVLAKAVAINPNNPFVLRAQAWDASARGDRTAAMKFVEQAILDPGHDAPETRSELEGLRLRFQSARALP